MTVEFFQELKEAYSSDQSFVLCTVIETIGSSPGKVGQKMIVYRDGTIIGTVGGGIYEEKTRLEALDLFVSGGSTTLNFNMENSDLHVSDPVCGGEAKVLIELQTCESRMVIFGAGHIGCLLAKMAKLIRFRVTIADERPEFADMKLFPAGIEVICKPYEEAVKAANLDKECFIVVATPGHIKDMEVIECVLPSKARYIGLVGSAKKTVQFKASLKEKGFGATQIDELFTPIGISLGSNTPEEIVIEILAQIVGFRNNKIIRYNKEF